MCAPRWMSPSSGSWTRRTTAGISREDRRVMAEGNGMTESDCNSQWERLLEREPLMKFSFYVSGRRNVLLDVQKQILGHLDDAFRESTVKMWHIEQAEGLMWL